MPAAAAEPECSRHNGRQPLPAETASIAPDCQRYGEAEADEAAITVAIAAPPDQIVASIVAALNSR